jgi:hypothetical protein
MMEKKPSGTNLIGSRCDWMEHGWQDRPGQTAKRMK